MSAENQESRTYPVDAIHYYPKDKRLVIEVEGGITFALSQTPEGLMAQLLLSQVVSKRAAVLHDDVVPAADSLLQEPSPPQAESPAPAPTTSAASSADPHPGTPEEVADDHSRARVQIPTATAPKRENQYLLTGRLKSKPVEGRPDGKGKPTAWARFAAHLDGSEEAWMLSTSFLRATRPIALGLESGEQITVEGYVNRNPDPEKMDRLNVFRFLSHKGTPPRQP